MFFAPSCGRILKPECLGTSVFPKVVLQLKFKFTPLPVFCLHFLFTGACSFSLPPWSITKIAGHIVRGEVWTWHMWYWGKPVGQLGEHCCKVFPAAHDQVSCWGPEHGQQELDPFNALSSLYLPFPSIFPSSQSRRSQLKTLIEKGVFFSRICIAEEVEHLLTISLPPIIDVMAG